jgi:putative ABC transport system permease protein
VVAVRPAERLYGWLLLLYPRGFRRSFGRELRASMRAHGAEARHRGVWGGMRLWGFLVMDLMRSLPAAHVDAARHRRRVRRRASESNRREATMLSNLLQDVRHAVRSYLRSPGFALACILTLALGIGATTTIFSVVDAVLLRPLPYPAPDRLVQIGMRFGSIQVSAGSPPDFFDIRARARTFDALAAARMQWLDLAGDGEPERFDAVGVTASYFDVLQVRPALGRAFDASGDVAGGEAVVVLSHGLWQRRFGGASAVLGRPLMLNGRPWTVIGVMPEGFVPPSAVYHEAVSMWFPLGQVEDDLTTRGDAFVQLIGRLAPDASIAAAEAELATIAAALDAEYPDGNERRYWIAGLHARTVGDVGGRLYVLLGAVTFLLLIACANVANLFLVRATERGREIALRAALGARRRRIAAQLLTESVVIGLAGGMVGVLLAQVGLSAFRALGPGDVPRLAEAALDVRVLGFATAVSLATSALFGLAPVLGGVRARLAQTMRDGGHGATTGRTQHALRGTLVAGQIAVALVLLVGAGLLINSFVRLSRVDAGFDPDHAVWLQVTLPERYQSAASRALFFDRLRERLRQLPGVMAAGGIHGLPLDGNRSITSLSIEGVAYASEQDLPRVAHHSATPGYFAALGIAIVQGRDFTSEDRADAPPVVIVSETFARTHWPDEAPLGKRVQVGAATEPWATVVGVAGDVRHHGLAEPAEPLLYRPVAQFARGNLTFALRYENGDAGALLRSARQAVWDLDATLPLDRFGTLTAHVRGSLVQPRFYTLLLAGFGVVALGLAFVGLYGTLAYTVRTRAREIGIRLALGAAGRDVHRIVIGQGMRLAAIGIVVGAAGALVASRVLRSLVFDVTPTDAPTFAAVALAMALVSLAACWLPARRAAGTDPMRTLRAE